jgi:4-amino-4-deoxy-L-arabinose transferase-like glycosyltransferase
VAARALPTRADGLLRSATWLPPLAGLVWTWAATRPAPALDDDSAEYLAAAESLLAGDGWLGVDGGPMTDWAPLYPLLLAGFQGLGLDPGAAAGAVNALAVAATSAACGAIARRVTGSSAGAFFGALASALVATVVAPVAWSEAAFTALASLSLLSWLRYAESPSWGRLLAVAAFAALALVQRYAGIALVAPLTAYALLGPASLRWRERGARGIGFLAVAVLPMALWALRNARAGSDPLGERGILRGRLASDLRCAGAELLAFAHAPEGPLGNAVAAVPMLCMALGAWLLIAPRRSSAEGRSIVAVFPLLWTASLVAARQTTMIDPIDVRLMAPAMPFVAITAVVGAHALARAGPPLGPAAGVAIAAWSLLWAVPEIVERAQDQWTIVATGGPGIFNSPHWSGSETIAAVSAEPPDGEVHSNLPAALYLRAGLRTRNLPDRAGQFERLGKRWARDGIRRTVVWFLENERSLFPEGLLGSGVECQRLRSWKDGELWEVRTTSPGDR